MRRLNSTEENPILSRLMSMIKLNRGRLLEILDGVTDEMLDFTPVQENIESIGTLLFHIAAVDWSWVFEDIDGKEMDYETWKYGFATRSSEVEQISGRNKDYYLELIENTRKDILKRLEEFKDTDLKKEFFADEVVNFTVDWLCFHLVNHEALHLGQISLLKRLYQLDHNPK